MGSVTSPLAVSAQAPPSGAPWLAQPREWALGLSSWKQGTRKGPGETGSRRIRTSLQDPLGSVREERKKETKSELNLCAPDPRCLLIGLLVNTDRRPSHLQKGCPERGLSMTWCQILWFLQLEMLTKPGR